MFQIIHHLKSWIQPQYPFLKKDSCFQLKAQETLFKCNSLQCAQGQSVPLWIVYKWLICLYIFCLSYWKSSHLLLRCALDYRCLWQFLIYFLKQQTKETLIEYAISIGKLNLIGHKGGQYSQILYLQSRIILQICK
jgi:hypothetical protein